MSKIMELNESMEPTFDQLSIDLISNTVLAYNIHIYHFWDIIVFNYIQPPTVSQTKVFPRNKNECKSEVLNFSAFYSFDPFLWKSPSETENSENVIKQTIIMKHKLIIWCENKLYLKCENVKWSLPNINMSITVHNLATCRHTCWVIEVRQLDRSIFNKRNEISRNYTQHHVSWQFILLITQVWYNLYTYLPEKDVSSILEFL